MKAWKIAAIGVGVIGVWYLYRNGGGSFMRVDPTPYVPPATGPGIETRSGRQHFTGANAVATALPAKGPTTETAMGRGHF